MPELEVSDSVMRSVAIFLKWSVQNLCHLRRVGLDFGFFSAAECAVGNIFPDVLVHTFPVILAFNKTVGISGSLVAQFVMNLYQNSEFPCLGYNQSEEFLIKISDMFIKQYFYMHEEISFMLRCFSILISIWDICLQKGSVFCICRRACSLSAVRDFGVGSLVSETFDVTSGCEVEVTGERH